MTMGHNSHSHLEPGESPFMSAETTRVPLSAASSASVLEEKGATRSQDRTPKTAVPSDTNIPARSSFDQACEELDDQVFSNTHPKSKRPIKSKLQAWFAEGGKLRPFRLLRHDIGNIRKRYWSDWALFNQLIFASAVYVFFTNILPGITFASDLYVLTGQIWGTIEVVFSMGLCGVIFSL
jgi:hypothetical protein